MFEIPQIVISRFVSTKGILRSDHSFFADTMHWENGGFKFPVQQRNSSGFRLFFNGRSRLLENSMPKSLVAMKIPEDLAVGCCSCNLTAPSLHSHGCSVDTKRQEHSFVSNSQPSTECKCMLPYSTDSNINSPISITCLPGTVSALNCNSPLPLGS